MLRSKDNNSALEDIKIDAMKTNRIPSENDFLINSALGEDKSMSRDGSKPLFNMINEIIDVVMAIPTMCVVFRIIFINAVVIP